MTPSEELMRMCRLRVYNLGSEFRLLPKWPLEIHFIRHLYSRYRHDPLLLLPQILNHTFHHGLNTLDTTVPQFPLPLLSLMLTDTLDHS